ncbi:MAG TPA: A24 family peptidase [Gemmatales bacterium]|nr:A24 family peptidase [Gemmatales bacterium]HMP59637.1 A24 family peptidase [Gemmatales bacterium]
MSLFAATAPTQFAPDQWVGLGILCTVLIVEAWIDLRQLRVPNKITLPMIVAGWLYALSRGFLAPTSTGPVEMFLWPFGPDFTLASGWADAAYGLWCSVKLTFLPALPLFLLWRIGGMGAGDVKMQMGFGAWLVPLYGYDKGWDIAWMGFFFAAIVGGFISALMIWWRGDFSQNKRNVQDIVGDLFKAQSVDEVARKAAERKPSMHLLPYGVPLCIGFIAYVVLDYFQMAPKVW